MAEGSLVVQELEREELDPQKGLRTDPGGCIVREHKNKSISAGGKSMLGS